MTISNDMATLLGFALETFLYGCNTTLFGTAIYLKLSGPDHLRGLNKFLFIITLSLYLLCSTHFVLGLIHFYNTLNTTGVNGIAVTKGTLIPAGYLISVTNCMVELILIYRCWVLWSKNYWVTIFPILAVFASVACATETLRLLLRITHGLLVAPASIVSWGLASFIVLLCGNAMVTTLIIGRIWYLSPRRRRDLMGANFPTGTGLAAIVITVESGLLYFVVQLIFCILFTIQNPGLYIINSIAIQIYGIAPTLIFIRMSDLLNRPSELVRSGFVSASRPVTTKLAFTHSTATSTDPGLTIELRTSEIERKPTGGDLGLNLKSVDCGTGA